MDLRGLRRMDLRGLRRMGRGPPAASWSEKLPKKKHAATIKYLRARRIGWFCSST